MTKALLDNGIRLEFEVYGQETDPAIVLIRGASTQLIDWADSLLEALVNSGLRVVIFDNRDAGLSSSCEFDYSLSDMAADVIGLLDFLHIERAHIFGLASGAAIAQLIGIEHGERVACLFCVMASTGNPDVPGISPGMYPYLVEKGNNRDEKIAIAVRNKGLFGSPGYPESEEKRRVQAERAFDRSYNPDGAARQLKAIIADGSRIERLPLITAPTLVIHGADDPLVPLAAGKDTAKHINGAQFLAVPGMGHNIPGALGDYFAQTITAFITSCNTVNTSTP